MIANVIEATYHHVPSVRSKRQAKATACCVIRTRPTVGRAMSPLYVNSQAGFSSVPIILVSSTRICLLEISSEAHL